MAELIMQVFHYQDATSDKLWAVCQDGPRVLTHWGRRDGRKLQGGGPIKIDNEDPYAAMQRRICEKIAEGYVQIGIRKIRDGVIINDDGDPAAQESVSESRIVPEAYTAFHHTQGWREKVETLFKNTPAYQVRWEPHPDIPGSDQLIIALDGAGEIIARISASSEVRIRTFEKHGPRGLLVVLAIAKAFQAKAYDAEGKECTGNWLTSHPERFVSGQINLETSRSEAALLGVIFQIQFKPGRGLGLFA